jgi:hypothetical protein
MSALKKYPMLVAALGLSGLVALGEGWCIFDRVRAAREAAATFAKKKAELQAMAGLAPAPKREVATAIEADLARAQRALDAMQAELKGRGPAAERLRTAKPPVARTDAYFDLATFVEKTRELAKAAEVDVKPEAARFGFSLYANEGPKAERIAPVFHQRLIAQYLVESLIEAKPRSLLAIKREPTLTKSEREKRDAALAAVASGAPPPPPDATPADPPEGDPDAPDFFTIDPRASARVPGYLEATAFKLTFVGQTTALRAFLNKLASFELPVLVREVEVTPATSAEIAIEVPAASDDASAAASSPGAPSVVLNAESAAPAAKPAAPVAPKAPGAAPIVAKPWCKFTVTVEYIELVPPAGTVADTAADPAKPTT